MERTYLYIWVGATAALSCASIAFKVMTGRKLPPSDAFFKASITLGGALMMFRIFLKVFNSDTIQAELESDGTLAICASTVWISFLGVKEAVVTLFFDAKKSHR